MCMYVQAYMHTCVGEIYLSLDVHVHVCVCVRVCVCVYVMYIYIYIHTCNCCDGTWALEVLPFS
jgi:hypothetical protein